MCLIYYYYCVSFIRRELIDFLRTPWPNPVSWEPWHASGNCPRVKLRKNSNKGWSENGIQGGWKVTDTPFLFNFYTYLHSVYGNVFWWPTFVNYENIDIWFRGGWLGSSPKIKGMLSDTSFWRSKFGRETITPQENCFTFLIKMVV